MALPREPRQKMINMMYLVLTALLALNVSSEILNAFKTVNNSLEASNKVVNASTTDIMSSLKIKLAKDETKERAAIWYPNAEKAQKITAELNDYIQKLKEQILKEAGANFASGDSSYKDDNLDIATRIMVEHGEGKNLYNKLQQYKKEILAIDPKINSEFGNSLPINLAKPKTKNKGNNTWEAAYFRMVPTVAALTILSKFQNDVKTSENRVVNFCHNQVGAVEVVYNRYKPIIGQNATVLLAGQKLQVNAGLAAFNNDKRPTVYIGGTKVELDAEGLAVKEFPVNSSGKVPVRIEYTDQEGKPQFVTKDVEYTVGQSSAAVQLDNMNVLFIGVENPVTISGSGSVDQIQASISGGGPGSALRGSGAKRIAWVTEQSENCVISVKTPDGKTTPVTFRVRLIPDPTSMIGTYKSGNIPAAYFKSQAGVRAVLENFYYKANFNVTSFHITADGAGFEDFMERNNTGATWNEAQAIITKCRPGSFITIDQIRAVGPDGRSRVLNPLVFALK